MYEQKLNKILNDKKRFLFSLLDFFFNTFLKGGEIFQFFLYSHIDFCTLLPKKNKIFHIKQSAMSPYRFFVVRFILYVERSYSAASVLVLETRKKYKYI